MLRPLIFAAALLAASLAVAAPLEPGLARQILTARNLGLAFLEQERPVDARPQFETLAKLLPSDPIGPTNAGLASLRMNDLLATDKWLNEALKRAPGRAEVHAAFAAWHEQGNRNAQAAASYEKVLTINPADVESAYRLARVLTHIGREQNGARIRELYAALLARRPENVVVLLRHGESELLAGNLAAARAAYERVRVLSPFADEKAKASLALALNFLAEGKVKEATPKLKIFENLEKAGPTYQQSLIEVFTNVQGLPIVDFAPGVEIPVAKLPEIALAFEPWSGVDLGAVRAVAPALDGVLLAGDGALRRLVANAKQPGLEPIATANVEAVLWTDLDGDPLPDLLALAAGKLMGWKGGAGAKFAPAALSGLPDVSGAKSLLMPDMDFDGDLDLLVLSPQGDRAFRNNRDGSFLELPAPGTRSIAAVLLDADSDGDVDWLSLGADGRLRLEENRRHAQFRDASDAAQLTADGVSAVAAGDLDDDGWPEIVLTRSTGALALLRNRRGRFSAAETIEAAGTGAALALLDLDNDGRLDVASARAGGGVRIHRHAAAPAMLLDGGDVRSLLGSDLDQDGDLDLVAATTSGAARLWRNQGGNANGWLEVKLEPLERGSGKINRLGIGARLEVKAGLTLRSRLVTTPTTWVGLGPEKKADVLRAVWPNGVPQNSLDVAGRRRVVEVEQLKGSCPFLYTWNGQRFEFFTDILGRAPLGLYYDGLHLMPADTSEWLPIPGSSLQPHPDGRVELRLTEELWETVYLDGVRLEAVDHPFGTELVTDERMIPPPFQPDRLDVVAGSRPVRRALDTDGIDVSERLANADGRFVDDFHASAYQGVADRDHWLELDLGPEAASCAATLDLTGWIQYTDTSINVALSQDSRFQPRSPVLEVPDGAGGWRIVQAAMGFPSGKTKVLPVDLDGRINAADPRVRIRTSLAIYWDRAEWSCERQAPHVRTDVPLVSATLSERGFSRRYRAFANGPQLFDYADVDPAIPRWRDMIGAYTQLGEVRELLTAVDDRLAIFKGGDEIALVFNAAGLPPLPAGWQRDWLFASDGWEKDADFNTLSGDTVEPLPFHAMSGYPYPDAEAGNLERREWTERWLTRRVTGDEFRRALGNPREPR